MDLNNNIIYFNNNVQQNLNLIHKKYKNKFKIINNDIQLPVILEKCFNSYLWAIKYDIKQRIMNNLPFYIVFGDYRTFEKNNNCYIGSIHKYGNYSGTQIMNTLLKFLKLIEINDIYLTDGTTIECKIKNKKIMLDLSYFKLIEKGQTFYQRFGFVPTFRNVYQKSIFKNERNMTIELNKNLKLFKKLKCIDMKQKYDDIIGIMKEYNKQIILYKFDPYTGNIKSDTYIEENDEKYPEIINIFSDISNVLNTTTIKFSDLLIELFYEDCEKYHFLEKYILKYDDIIGIKYKNNKKYLSFFSIIFKIRLIRNATFIYHNNFHLQPDENMINYTKMKKK